MDPLEIARQKRQEMKEAGIETERLDPIQKAAKNPKSLRALVNANCWVCVGGSVAVMKDGEFAGWTKGDGGAIGRIRNCSSVNTCQLWPARPYQVKSSEE